MSIDSTFSIEVGTLTLATVTTSSPYDRLLGVQANLRISVHGREWFSQPMFPVVELARAINRWFGSNQDLEFDTMEASESPFLWVRRTPDGCKIGAAWERFKVEEPLSLGLVKDSLKSFLRDIRVEPRNNLAFRYAL